MGETIIVKQLDYFFDKIGANFIGEGILIKLVSAGYKSVHDILNALSTNTNKKQLATIDGIGDKLVNKIFESVNTALEKVKLNTLMAASHVFGRGLGERKIKEIIMMYPNILNDKSVKQDLMNKILAVDGFSTITATKFCDNLEDFRKFLSKLKTIEYVKSALAHLDVPNTKTGEKPISGENANKKQDLTGKVFVFTGFRDKNLEEKINELNGKVSTSVSKKTSVVVKASDAESSSKLIDADKLGVPIFIKQYDLE
jgi:DNA ligase (NAD+)